MRYKKKLFICSLLILILFESCLEEDKDKEINGDGGPPSFFMSLDDTVWVDGATVGKGALVFSASHPGKICYLTTSAALHNRATLLAGCTGSFIPYTVTGSATLRIAIPSIASGAPLTYVLIPGVPAILRDSRAHFINYQKMH